MLAIILAVAVILVAAILGIVVKVISRDGMYQDMMR